MMLNRAPQVSVKQDNDLLEDITRYIHDPHGFVMYAFPWNTGELKGEEGPDLWQIEILQELGNGLLTVDAAVQLAVASGHGVGKSALVAWIMLWAMSTCEDCRGVVTANTENQLKTKTWAELSKWYRLLINKHWFRLTATALFSIEEGHQFTWRIDQVTWSEQNTEAFAGLHNKEKRILVIFDEGSAIPDLIWEVTEGALTDEDTEIIWCAFGNPTRNTGRFKECFYQRKHRWVTKQIDSRTSNHTNKAQIEEWIEDYGIGSDFVKVRVLGIFPSLSVKQFISVKDVDLAYNKELKNETYNFAPVILTCDPAWEGDDELVIGKRQGLKFDILEVIPKNDNDIEIASILARHEDEEKADAVFIDAGYGTGIVSAGRTLRRSWRLVWFNEASQDKGCLNKRAEMWNKMRLWLKDGGSIPKDQILYNDLIGPETVPRIDGKIQLESKKDMKKRKQPSPNRADALALSFAYPVLGEVKERARRTNKIATSTLARRSKANKGWNGEYQEVYAN